MSSSVRRPPRAYAELLDGKPIISVAIPVFNGEKTLDACLSSVAAALARLDGEARKSIEVVVCDNRSTDNTPEIADNAAQSAGFRVIRPPEHLPNRTENWNRALQATNGTWVALLHADDALVPGGARHWLDAITSRRARRAVLVNARHVTFTDDLAHHGRPRPTFPLAALVSGRLVARWALPLMCPFVPFTLMRRSAYDAVGGLDPTYQLVQDWDLWKRISNEGDILYWPHVVGAWRLHPTSPSYQRLNMREHVELTRLALEAAPPPVATIARRATAARVASVLADDDTADARSIRDEAASLSRRPSQRWNLVARHVTAAVLFNLRLAGALGIPIDATRSHPTP